MLRPEPACDVDLLAELAAIVGEDHLIHDPGMMTSYTLDWTGRFSGEARAVVRPASTAEVVAVISACRAAGVAIVPQGGNTGLVGGSVPRCGEVVVSTTRLRGLAEVDVAAGTLVVGAGTTLAETQAHSAPSGLWLPVDLAARDTATVGGMVATNAGGHQVIRYGSMRSHVLGVEAVLADGSVIQRLSGLAKDNTGYDLAGLLTGSEGTLAVITRVALKLAPKPRHRVTALLALDELAHLAAVIQRFRAEISDLEAVEVVLADGLALAVGHAALRVPFSPAPPAVLLVECAGPSPQMDRIAEVVGSCPQIVDAAVADDRHGRASLWAYRERLLEAVTAAGPPVKLDVTIPARHLVAFLAEVPQRIRQVVPAADTVLFGHAGDGNVHVNVLHAIDEARLVEDTVLEMVLQLGGSISAEHGIGVAKRRWLVRDRGEPDVAAMRALKRAMDPTNLLNPGVLLDLD